MNTSGLSAVALVPKAQSLHDGMVGNVQLPNPIPTPAEFQALIDTLVTANANVDANKGPAEIFARSEADTALRNAIRAWAGYVQAASLGNPVVIRSANFDVAKRPTRVGELPPPQNLGARLTNFTGRVALHWKRDPDADMNHVFMSTSNAPFNWQLIGATTKSRFNADSLEPGTFNWFAVSALGAAGESSKSEPCLVMAAA